MNMARVSSRTKEGMLPYSEKELDGWGASSVCRTVDRDSTTYHPAQHIPVYQTIEKGNGYKKLVFEEPETLVLDPGSYYMAIRFVEFEGSGSLNCKGYFKNAYERNGGISAPLSIGLKVSGVEY